MIVQVCSAFYFLDVDIVGGDIAIFKIVVWRLWSKY